MVGANLVNSQQKYFTFVILFSIEQSILAEETLANLTSFAN